MKKLLLIIVLFAASANSIIGQENTWCGTAEVTQKMFLKDPKLKQDFESSFSNSAAKSDDTTVFIIPVVFHILHEYGTENISDAQVHDQMEILNEDFRAMNSDTLDIILAFKQIYGDAKIQFRLANLDPYGNVTNGIDRIYTHLTNNASDYSKINQWDRASYLNIWVVKSIGTNGVAGYTYFPSPTNGENFCLDGIIMLNNYIGSIGTGTFATRRTLTHEVGHWVGLVHPWGSSGGVGQPDNCEIDDFIEDTPLCKGASNCSNLNTANTCDDLNDPNNYSEYTFDIIDNIQNFMEFSYCLSMFTKKQCSRMRDVLQSTDGQRNELISLDNLLETGVLNDPPLVAAPTPDFYSPNRNPCIGTAVNFKDNSNNAPVTSRLWTFQDGTPSTSTAVNPTVVFNSQGAKTVTLTVTNASGSNTLTIPSYIVVNNNFADYMGPHTFDLNDPLAQIDWFRVDNPENNSAFYQHITNNGFDNSGCFRLTNSASIPSAQPCTDEYNYFNQLAGVWDHLITPSFDLRFTTGASFSFDYSFGTNTTDILEMTEYIQVFKSNDCGITWNPLTGSQGKIEGIDLASSGGYAGQNTFYVPSSNSQWQNKSINFNTSSIDAKTRFRISFNAGPKSNNLYIDNIKISGTGNAGISDFGQTHDLVIAPNPVNAGSSLNVAYTAQNEPVTFTLKNLQGQEVMSTVKNETNQMVSFNLEIDSKLPSAYYFLEVKSASAITVKKIVVLGY